MSRTIPLIAGIALVAGLAACGGSSSDDTASTTEAAPATTEAAPTTTEAAPETTEAAPTTTEAAPETTEAAPETTAAPTTTEAAPETTEAAPETTAAPTEPNPDRVVVPAYAVTLPGTQPLDNPTFRGILDDLTAGADIAGSQTEILAQFGVDLGPHFTFADAEIYEINGSVNNEMAGVEDEITYNMTTSYAVQSATADPVGAIDAIEATINEIGAYDISRSQSESDGVTSYFIDARPTNFSDPIPRISAGAVSAGEFNAGLEGVVLLNVDVLGAAESFVIPASHQAVLDRATTESPVALTPFSFRSQVGVNSFSGSSINVREVESFVDGAASVEDVITQFADTLPDTYTAVEDDDPEREFWSQSGIPGATWVVRLTFDELVAAEFGISQ